MDEKDSPRDTESDGVTTVFTVGLGGVLVGVVGMGGGGAMMVFSGVIRLRECLLGSVYKALLASRVVGAVELEDCCCSVERPNMFNSVLDLFNSNWLLLILVTMPGLLSELKAGLLELEGSILLRNEVDL